MLVIQPHDHFLLHASPRPNSFIYLFDCRALAAVFIRVDTPGMFDTTQTQRHERATLLGLSPSAHPFAAGRPLAHSPSPLRAYANSRKALQQPHDTPAPRHPLPSPSRTTLNMDKLLSRPARPNRESYIDNTPSHVSCTTFVPRPVQLRPAFESPLASITRNGRYPYTSPRESPNRASPDG